MAYTHKKLGDTEFPVTQDSQGNIDAVQIRSSRVVHGDGSNATIDGGVVLGTNSTATGTASIVLGSVSTAPANGLTLGAGITNTINGSAQIGTAGVAHLKMTSTLHTWRVLGGFSQSNAPSAATLLSGCVQITAQATLPTAAQIVAAIPNCVQWDTFQVVFVNSTAGALNIRGGSPAGITHIDTSSTIAAQGARTVMFVVTNAGSGTEAVSVY